MVLPFDLGPFGNVLNALSAVMPANAPNLARSLVAEIGRQNPGLEGAIASMLPGARSQFDDLIARPATTAGPADALIQYQVGAETAGAQPVTVNPGGGTPAQSVPPVTGVNPAAGLPPRAAPRPGGQGQPAPNQGAGTAPAPNAGGPPVTASGAPNPASGNLTADPWAAGMLRYTVENPAFALQSALIDRGINPFAANPAMGLLMRRAPGLAQAFMLANIGATADDISERGGDGAMFRDFLARALSNGMGAPTLAAAPGQLSGAFAKIAAMNAAAKAGGLSLSEVNPFAAMLANVYGSPSGGAGAYAALTTPFMSGDVGRAFSGALQNAAGGALRRFAGDLEGDAMTYSRNFWEYLFPNL